MASGVADYTNIWELSIWDYLGEGIKKLVLNRLDTMSNSEAMVLKSALVELETIREEVITTSSEATFVYILRDSLGGLVSGLELEISDIKKECFDLRESGEQADDIAKAEDLLSQASSLS